MQAPAVHADTFPHVADSLIRGVAASLPGGAKVSATVVIVAIVLINLILVVTVWKGLKGAGGIKLYLADFPSHNAATALSLLLIFETGLVVVIRLALGLIFPSNYDTWIWALVGLAGVNVAGLIGKRATDDKYVAAKAAGKAGAPGVNVEGDANISTTAERRAPAPSRATDKAPAAGVQPSNVAIAATLDDYAAQQKAAIAHPGEADD